MIYFFTDPYEDEIFYSILDRYNRYSGNLSATKTEKELFDKKTYNQKGNFPCYLDFFSKQLSKPRYTPDYFIKNHTVLPMYKPFLPEKRMEQIVEDMKGDKAVSIHMRIGEMAGGICKDSGIRVCLSCMAEDKKKYGESYIHRIHQVPGNQICNKHNEVLRRIILPQYFKRDEFVDLKKCEIDMKNSVVDDYNFDDYSHLSMDISSIFRKINDEMNLNNTIKKYKVMLMKKGFSSICGVTNWSQIEKQLLEFYSYDFLNGLESNLNDEDNYKWTRQLLKEKKLVHPIRHLLFIRFLFGNVKNFVSFNELEYRPFGQGPWPCLNPVASHYKKDVIVDIELSRRNKPTKPLGIFKCSCGYTYTRLGPDMCDDDKYKKRFVKSYGEVWMNELENNIRKQIYNISELEKIMECDSKTIGKYAKRLEIFNLLKSKMKTENIAPLNLPRYDKTLEENYKADVLSFIKDNLNATRSQIIFNLQKQCAWLYRYRRHWFNSILPQSLDRHIDKRKRKSYVDWVKRDEELSEKIQQVIDKIKLEKSNMKITINLLVNKLKFPISKHLDKLPKTESILKLNLIIKNATENK